MEYLFVLKDKGTSNQGWWLKITDAEQLIDYIENTDFHADQIIQNYLEGKEFNSESNKHWPYPEYYSLTQAIVLFSQSKHLNIFDGIRLFRQELAFTQLHTIRQCGGIYINRKGGYHAINDSDKEYGFVRRKHLVFPSFKLNDIRIKKFEGGNHYYAYIDDMQVRDDNTVKWNTYEEAYNFAKSIVEDSEEVVNA